MVVVVAGRVKHDDIVKLVERLMGDMPPGKAGTTLTVTKELAHSKTAVLHKDTAQTHLVISTVAYPFLHPNDPAAKLIATILGRGLSSRLFMNVRERQGLAYSVSAGLENFVDTGEFEVSAGVNTAKAPQAVAAILDELRRIATEPVESSELNKAKNQIRGSLEMAMEHNSTVADRAATQMILLGQLRSVEQTLQEIQAVTAADIRRVAAEMLRPGRLRLGVISSDPDPAADSFTRLTA
jgi:predicted Zn-dependent peptidase